MIEKAVIKLLEEGRNNNEANFYGHYLLNVKRHYTDKVPTAGVSVTDTVNLYVNPKFWSEQDLGTQVEILKHEMDHIFKDHMFRAQELGLEGNMAKSYYFNIAADSIINKPLKKLHEFGVTYEKLKQQIPDLKDDEITEYYYYKINQKAEENQKNGQGDQQGQFGDTIDDHSTWSEGEDVPEEIRKQVLKESLKKTAEDCGGIGNAPYEIRSLLDKLNKSTINWKQQLRSFFARCDKFEKTSSRKKRNRRYGVMYAGKKKLPNMHLAILNDESGSVSNEEFAQFYSEIDYIKNLYGDRLTLTIIHVDTQINKVYEYKKGMEVERTGCGGTTLKPAFEKAIELEVDGLIAFTDGGIWGNDWVKTPFPTLWAIVNNKEFEAPFGRKIDVEVSNEN